MPNPTPLRNIRIDDKLWQAAQDKAEAEGRTVSDVIRFLLRQWVET